MVANHLESEFSESFKTISKKFFFSMMDFLIFFSPKMVPFHDFFVKINENKGKTLVFDSFPLFFIDFGGFLGKS